MVDRVIIFAHIVVLVIRLLDVLQPLRRIFLIEPHDNHVLVPHSSVFGRVSLDFDRARFLALRGHLGLFAVY